MAGDTIVTMTDEMDAPAVYDYMEKACTEKENKTDKIIH